jgi:hypothetical protein
LEPEHRRVVRARLAELLGQKLEKVVSPAVLAEIARDASRLGRAVETLQKDFGVKVDPRAIQGVRTVNQLVTLVADAARKAGRPVPPPPRAAEASPLEQLLEKPASPPPSAPASPAPAKQVRQATGETYQSSIAYEGERIHAAAIYCSDGRIGDQVDDFLHNGLGLPRYDRVACPGGPVALAGRLSAFWECHGVEEQLRFLLKVHEVHQVVLVAHQPCAYYLTRLGIPQAALEAEQRRDLEQAAYAVQRADRTLEVAGFIAWLEGASVRFEKVLATAALGERVSRWRSTTRT